MTVIDIVRSATAGVRRQPKPGTRAAKRAQRTRKARADRRRAHHEELIDAEASSRRKVGRVLDWLAAESAHNPQLRDELLADLLDLARTHNERSGQ